LKSFQVFLFFGFRRADTIRSRRFSRYNFVWFRRISGHNWGVDRGFLAERMRLITIIRQKCLTKGRGRAISDYQDSEAKMSQEEVIKIARRVLSAENSSSDAADGWLWGRTQRLLRNVEAILSLEELAGANLPVDRFCLTTAVYFSEAGFSGGAPSVELSPVESGKLASEIVSKKLDGVVSEQKINKINRIIIESRNKLTKMTEAKILSDARGLDDMGAAGIFNQFRRFGLQGKGAEAAVESWNKKIDYGYWRARLEESFHFGPVRQTAQRRFEAAGEFMSLLGKEIAAEDIEEETAGQS
jgi:hypothetical protein